MPASSASAPTRSPSARTISAAASGLLDRRRRASRRARLRGRPADPRLQGHYLAVATLGLGIIVVDRAHQRGGLTGGPDGMSVPRLSSCSAGRVRGSARLVLDRRRSCCIGGLARHEPGRQPDRPRAARGPRRRDRRAHAGVDVRAQKLLVFVVSAVYASVGGLLSRATRRLHHAGRGGLSALDRAGRRWSCWAAWARSSAPWSAPPC